MKKIIIYLSIAVSVSYGLISLVHHADSVHAANKLLEYKLANDSVKFCRLYSICDDADIEKYEEMLEEERAYAEYEKNRISMAASAFRK